MDYSDLSYFNIQHNLYTSYQQSPAVNKCKTWKDGNNCLIL